jgi:hypothetical protein
MTVLWTKTMLVGALLAESELALLPARPWPLEAAIETLGERAPQGSPLAGAARGWLRERPSPSGRVLGVGAWLREAAEAGLLRPEGRGWEAGYRPRKDWLRQAAQLRAVISASEATALNEAAQRLAAMSTMLWKNAAA